MAAFPDFLTRADHAARMDRRIGARDFTTAMRAAARVGPSYASIVKACVAVAGKEKRARALLEKVPGELRQNLGYLLCRIQWLLNNEGTAMKALRKRCGWCSKHRARQWRGKTPTNGGVNAAFWPASCSARWRPQQLMSGDRQGARRAYWGCYPVLRRILSKRPADQRHNRLVLSSFGRPGVPRGLILSATAAPASLAILTAPPKVLWNVFTLLALSSRGAQKAC